MVVSFKRMNKRPKKIALMGATGSIGLNTLDIIEHHPDDFQIAVLSAQNNWQALAKQALKFKPDTVVIANDDHYKSLKTALSNTGIQILCGKSGLVEAAATTSYDMMVAGISGFAGLPSLYAAIEAGRDIAFGNKECLVCAGDLIMQAVSDKQIKFLPIDSEHNAIFQVFENDNARAIKRLVLTASGGPFRDRDWSDLKDITPDQAVAHPNWSMGAKISVDSATMMNKALEMIEAHYLFHMPYDKIDAVLHPQSMVHSFVEYQDGSWLSQAGPADMRTPILYAVGHPQRLETRGDRLDLTAKAHNFNFYPIKRGHYPLFDLARDVMMQGQEKLIAMNAANEVAVHAFLKGQIGYHDILRIIEAVLETVEPINLSTIDNIIAFDAEFRIKTKAHIK